MAASGHLASSLPSSGDTSWDSPQATRPPEPWMPLLSVRADLQDPLSSPALPSALSDQLPSFLQPLGTAVGGDGPGDTAVLLPSFIWGLCEGDRPLAHHNRPSCGRGSPGANETSGARTIDACISRLLSRPSMHPLSQGPLTFCWSWSHGWTDGRGGRERCRREGRRGCLPFLGV